MSIKSHNLDAFIVETDRLGGPGSEACSKYWANLQYEPTTELNKQLFPDSQEYFEQQMNLYRELTGHEYADARDEMTHGVPIDRLLRAPNAYDEQSPATYGRHCVAMGQAVNLLQLPRGARILELGSGWGFTQEFLASCGFETVGIEINPQFVATSNARLERLGFGKRVLEGAFDTFSELVTGKFDCVFSYEAFHHAVHPQVVLQKCRDILNPAGKIALLGEPVNDYYKTWGLRLDPYSIYCIKKFGWFESGWSSPYMLDMLGRAGFSAEYFDFGWNEFSKLFIGRLGEALKPAQLSMWDPNVASGWWLGADHMFSRGSSVLVLHPPANAETLNLSFSNFSPNPMSVKISGDVETQKFELQTGKKDVTLRVPLNDGLRLNIESSTFVPKHHGINDDERRLGVHLDDISWL